MSEGRSADAHGEVRVEPYSGPREDLRALFELAEDSPAELNSYLPTGQVLVALSGGEVIGHLQLVDTSRPGQVELKNMADRETHQGRGVGRRLLQAAVDLAAGSRAPPQRVLPGHLRGPRRTESRDWIGDKGYVGRGMITPIKKTNLENSLRS